MTKPKTTTVAKVDDDVREDVKNPELVHFEVTLRNGNTVPLAALKNEDDWDLELVEHLQRNNYAVFLFGILTADSNFRLKAADAKVPDFEAVTIAYAQAVKAVKED